MKFEKQLGLIEVFSISSGVMISAGLFILPGIAHAQAGPAVILSYFIAGILAATGMLTQAELASAMPRAGGTYFYVTRSMGPAVGTIYGLITWLALCLKSAFAMAGIGIYAALIIDTDIRLILISLILIFVILNITGIKEAGRVQSVLIFTILLLLLLYSVLGLSAVQVKNFEPFAPKGLSAIFSTAGLVFVSYGGLLKVASVGEEVKEPGRIIPLGMIIALCVVALFYLAVLFVTVGVLGASELDSSLTPVSDSAEVFMGPIGKIALSVVAILAFLSASNAGIMAASRYPMALSRDQLLPEFMGRINERFKTPHVSVLLTGAVVIASIFMKIEFLVKAASTVLILTYLFTCLSIIILKESGLQNYRPQFKAPLYPWLQVFGIIGFVLLLLEIGIAAILTTAVLMAAGFLVYWFYGRLKIVREYALRHLVERVTDKEFTSHMLETELKEIIRERDDIIKDRFDHVIEDSIVVDLEGPINFEEFFRTVAEEMSGSINVKPDLLHMLLLEREKESSTAISPLLAIPHIVIEGENTFNILLARCRNGISFSESSPDVKAVFVLICTRDERNFHLQALSAIAQIVQSPDFEEKWFGAKGKEALRDIILLGERKRVW